MTNKWVACEKCRNKEYMKIDNSKHNTIDILKKSIKTTLD